MTMDDCLDRIQDSLLECVDTDSLPDLDRIYFHLTLRCAEIRDLLNEIVITQTTEVDAHTLSSLLAYASNVPSALLYVNVGGDLLLLIFFCLVLVLGACPLLGNG